VIFSIPYYIRLHMSTYLPQYSDLADPSGHAVCGRALAGIVGSNPTGGMDVCLLWLLRVLLGGGLCDGPIPRPEESYRLWWVCECDSSAKKQPRHPLWVGRRGKDYENSDLQYTQLVS
jgi:hypothetical protein